MPIRKQLLNGEALRVLDQAVEQRLVVDDLPPPLPRNAARD
jgi:hypothetical protein